MDRPHTSLSGAEVSGDLVRFAWDDGFEAAFACAWLLDNAPSDGSIGGHRTRTARILAHAGPLAGITLAGDIARLAWAKEIVEWQGASLRARAERPADAARTPDRILWPAGADIAGQAPIAYADYLADDAALARALSEVARCGLVRLTGAPAEDAAIEQVVARFGFIRETNYGRLFEVRVVAQPNHLADTARALEPHTDNPYREPAPTLQLLQCVQASGEGGATFFLDGFALAEDLRREHPEDFARLAGEAVPFGYATAGGERYEARSPVLRLDVDGALAGIRFNHRALGAVAFEAELAAAWYASYQRFAAEADAPRRRLPLAMQPGDMVLFDNERVLHGRDAFSGPAERLIKGCYCDRDGLRATLARLSQTQDRVSA